MNASRNALAATPPLRGVGGLHFLRAAGQCLVALALLAPCPAIADGGDDQFAVAAAHYRHQRWDLAATEFAELLEAQPKHARAPFARFFLAEARMQAGQYADAVAAYQNVLKQDAGGRYAGQAQFRLGEAAYLAHQPALAEEALAKFVADHPDDSLAGFAWPYLADLAEARGDLAQARERYETSLRKFPEGPRASDCRLALARLHAKQGDHGAAERLLKSSSATVAWPAAFELAASHYAQGKFAESAADFGALVDRATDDQQRAKATLGQAWSLFQSGDAEQAQPLFETLRELPAHRIEAEYGLALSAQARGDRGAARELLERIAPEADAENHRLAAAVHLQLGDCLLAAGDVEQADEQFVAGLEASPLGRWAPDLWLGRMRVAQAQHDDASVLRLGQEHQERFASSALRAAVGQMIARIQLRQGDFKAAARTLEPLADVGPLSAQLETRLLLAQALAGGGDQAGALAQFEAAKTDGSPALAERLAVAKADVLASLERHLEAAELLELAIKAQPESPALAGRLALEWVRCGRVADALDLQRRTWFAARENPAVQRNLLLLAEELLVAHEPLAALPCFAALTGDDLPPNMQTAGLWGAGRCLYERQDWEAALERFEQLIETQPNAPESAEAGLIAAQVLERLNRPDAALHQYQRLLDHKAADDIAARALLAAARLHGRLRQFKDATAKYQRLLQEFPRSAEADAALYGWARTEQEQGRADQALELFARLNREYPESRYWPDSTFRLAKHHAAIGDGAAADPFIEQLATRLPPENELRSHARFLAAQMALKRQDWNSAATALDRLLNENAAGSLASTAEFWRAEAAYRLNDHLDAQTRFDALDALPRDDQLTWRGTVPLRRAQLRAQQEQWREALAIVETIRRDYPKFSQQQEVDYLRGRCLASLGELRAAREAYRDALAVPGGAKTETAAMAQWMIGETWFHQGDYGQAIREYLRGQTLYGYPRWQAASLLQAGKCSELLGDRRQAVDLYRQLLEKHAEPPFADEARQRLAELEPAVATKKK